MLATEKCGRFVSYIVLEDTKKRFQSDLICDELISKEQSTTGILTNKYSKAPDITNARYGN